MNAHSRDLLQRNEGNRPFRYESYPPARAA